MILQELYGHEGLLLPNAIYIPKGEEIAISQDWLIFPEAITGDGKVWTIDGLLEHCIKPDNEVWVDSNIENPFAEPIIYKGKNKYGWQVGEIAEDVTNELDYIDRKSVRNIILSNYITEIPDKAFFQCYDLQNIIISHSVKRIGNIAFYQCGALQTLTIPDTVIEIGGGVFANCYSIRYIKLPNTLTHLDQYFYTHEEYGWSEHIGFFSHCGSLQTIILPQTLQSLGDMAFFNCFSLTSIVIPNGVTSIGIDAFQGCNYLTSVTIPNSVANIEAGAFYQCYNLTSLTIPESVTSIEEYAFEGCSSLTSVTIPNSVTSIEYNAFYECQSMNDLILGNSVNYIGHNTFGNCPLQRIVSFAETPPTIEYSTFENVDKSILLEVPNADLYREAPYWQEFYNIYNINPYQLNISSNNEEWGTVKILEHNTNRSVIEAYCKDGYVFKQWSDGDTNVWRELHITENTTLIAEFEKIYTCNIKDLHIINNTSTQITLGFSIECDSDVETFEYVSAEYSHSGLMPIGIHIDNRPGYQEIIINDLLPNTLYTVRIAVINNTYQRKDASIEFSIYEYVDLGLPSGTLWASCNIGAVTPENPGLLFQWGDTRGYTVGQVGADKIFYWNDYPFGAYGASSKYNTREGLKTLALEDDAAHTNWGNGWYTPTQEQFEELFNNTVYEYIDNYNNTGVSGLLFTGNGNQLFLPHTGYAGGDFFDYGGGYYWTSSIGDSDNESYYCYFNNSISFADLECCNGLAVRAVRNL